MLSDGTEASEGGHDRIRPIYREDCTSYSSAQYFAERACHWFLYKGNDYTEYSMLDVKR